MFRRWALLEQIHRARGACAVGFTDDSDGTPEDMSIGAMPLTSWISSYCFLMTAEAMQRLGGRVHDPDEIASCIVGGSDECSFFPAKSRRPFAST